VPLPPPPPLQAYHYWKCYRKEGITFQTAKLFSIEVDYYNFGTCELTDGAYFCGDHSCQTFKHVGSTGHHGLPTTTYEHLTAQVPVTGDEWPITQRHNAFVAAPAVSNMAGQGFVHRMGETASQYYEHSSLKLSYATIQTYNPNVVRSILDDTGTHLMSPLHHGPLVAGDCRRHCDADPTCMIYTENKDTGPRSPRGLIKCRLYHSDHWPHELVNFDLSLLPNHEWNTYSKISHSKPDTWLHAPVQYERPDLQTSKRGPQLTAPEVHATSAARDRSGRRLSGLY